jgi:hypothetical protein
VLLNELAQWAALVVLGVFVLGLTRQLGAFLTPRAQELADMGPDVGQPLPEFLFTGDERGRLIELIAGSSATRGTVLVLDERCAGCRALVEDLRAVVERMVMPLAVVLKESRDDDFRRAVAAIAALVVHDETGAVSQRAGIFGTPFAMVIDGSLTVVEKKFAADLPELLTQVDRPVVFAVTGG